MSAYIPYWCLWLIIPAASYLGYAYAKPSRHRKAALILSVVLLILAYAVAALNTIWVKP